MCTDYRRHHQTSPLLLWALLLACALISAAADIPAGGNILYTEDFSQYAVGHAPPPFQNGTIVADEGGGKAIHFQGCLFSSFDAMYHDMSWQDYEVEARIRFPEAGKIGAVFVVRQGGARPAEHYVSDNINLSNTGIGGTVNGIVAPFPVPAVLTPRDLGMAPLQAGVWYHLTIRVSGQLLQVFLEHET